MAPYGTSEQHADLPRNTPHLLALVGERIATLVSTINQPRKAGEAAGSTSAPALAALERLGMQLQQLFRMVAHEGPARPETIDLNSAGRQAAAEWQPRADAAHVLLQVHGSSIEADVNAAALTQTLDLLIEYGLDCGERVVLSAQRVGAPAQPAVRFDITLRELMAATVPATPAELDALLPMLADMLARGTGMRLERSVAGKTVTLLLAIPPPSSGERFAENDDLLPRTPWAVGRRILIVDPHTASRLKAHQLLNEAGMLADAVENVPQARAALRDGAPDVLISGLPTHGPEMADLVDDMRAACPTLRVIELVDAENAFAFSMPGADAPGRLSRDELEAHLTMAVSEEIYGARPG